MGAAILLLLISAGALAQSLEFYPVAKLIEPRSGVPGTVVRMSGTALEKAKVDEVYLTDHRFNLLVKVLDQESESMTIRIPPFAKPGRYQILFLSNRKGEPVLLEQPLYLTVEPGVPVAVAPAASPAPVAAAVVTPPTPAPAPAPVVVAKAPEVPPPAPPAPIVVAKVTPPPPAPTPMIESPAPQRGVVTADSGPASTRPKPVVVSPDVPAPSPVKPAPVETAQLRSVTTPAPVPVPRQAVPVAQPAVPAESEGTAIASATPVEVVKKFPPAFSVTARQLKLSGAVTLRVMVDPKGAVKAVEVVEGNPILGASASDAVKRWSYKPATLRGAPISSSMMVRVTFAPPN